MPTEIKFANDCAKSYLSRKNVAQRKQKFELSFAKIAQKICEWKPYSRGRPVTFGCE